MKQDLHPSVWRRCGLIVLSFAFSLSSIGQMTEKASYMEAGITIGPSNFLGDLGGNMGKGTPFLKDNNFQMTKLSFGGFLSYHPNEWLGVRLGLNIGTLEGDDAIIKGKGGYEEARKIRNSNFKSKLAEVLLMAEIYPTVFFEYDPSDIFMKFRPYGVIGVGGFHFNPKGTDPLTGQWVDLKPLRTEGQGFPEYPDRKEYSLTQVNIPMGVGLKYFLSENVNISFEIVHRKTFTDYIDDVSTNYIDPALFSTHMSSQQAALAARMANKTGTPTSRVFNAGDKRGNPNYNDSYYTAGFKLGFRLNSGNNYRNSTSCPIRF
ncbi:MAG TPA: outer membrane beta-barrel protein [Flavitalea sp.]|nr:outer membrane beta-barrel protein [Flavitalea sp.]